MKLLVLNYEYPPLGGGAAPACQDLCETYACLGHTVDVVTMGFRQLPAREERHGVRIRRVWAMRKRQETCETPEMLSYVASAYPRVMRRLWFGGYDAVHCHFIVPTGLLALMARMTSRTPYIITAHGSDVPGYNPDRFTKEHRVMTPLLRTIVGRARAITTPSRYLAQLIDEHIGTREARVIPYGIDTTKFARRERKKRILLMSRLLPRKGFQYVLEGLRDVETDWEIHIAGDGPMRAELETMAQAMKMTVVFHGWLDHDSPPFKELYETSSILCLPSESDNSPVSLMEAMVAGMAIVTSNITGCPEIVGEAAVLVPPRDPQALREALTRLMHDDALRADLGAKAHHRAQQEYALEAVAQRYLDLMK